MKLFMKIALVVSMASVSLIICASGPRVSHLDTADDTDLTGYWSMNDVDAVCADLIGQFLESPSVARFEAANGRLPVIRVGTFKNASSEPIDTSIVSKRMQVQILNSGKAEFVADSGVSDELRAEATDQQRHAAEDSAAALDEETGADFLLTGAVKTIIQTAGNQQTRSYDVTADATNVTTHRIIWSGENDRVRKQVVRPKNKF
jgi:PBP1b-binding outer membrane lipoprotein LpoB